MEWGRLKAVRWLIAALCICFVFGSVVSAQRKTDRDLEGLLGPVKTVSITRIETSVGNVRPGEPKSAPSQSLTFDERGHMIEQYLTNRDGIPWKKWVYEYDANGYKSQQLEYDPTGRITTKKTFRYEFNTQGKVSTTLIYDADGKLYNRMVKTYNDRGLQTENITYDSTGSVSNKSIFTYDGKGAITEFALYNSAGVLVQKQIPRDAENEMVLSNDDGTLKMREIRSNPKREEFDAHGNWIKETASIIKQSGKAEEVFEVTRRIITYY
jgi:hypothetical protein